MRARKKPPLPPDVQQPSSKSSSHHPVLPSAFTFHHDGKVAYILLPPICLLLLVGGQQTMGVLSFCFLLLYVADLLQLTSVGVASSLFLHACVAVSLFHACFPLVWHSPWNLNIFILVALLSSASAMWSLLHFHDLRRTNIATLAVFERILLVAMPPASVGVVAWGVLSFVGPEHAPWIVVAYSSSIEYVVSCVGVMKVSWGEEWRREYWLLMTSLVLLPSLFHWGLHHNILPPFHVRAVVTTTLCDQITIFLLPLLCALLCGISSSSDRERDRKRNSKSSSSSSNSSAEKTAHNSNNEMPATARSAARLTPRGSRTTGIMVLLVSAVVGSLLLTFWYRHRHLLLRHKRSTLRSLGVKQPFDTIIVLGVPTSLSLLLVLHMVSARTVHMLPCVFLLYGSSMTCLGAPWTTSLVVSSIGSWCLLRCYRLVYRHDDDDNTSGSLGSLGSHGSRGSHRRSAVLCFAASSLCFLLGWCHGSWCSYGSLSGAGFVWRADMAMVQGIHGGGDSVEKNVSTTSMLIVGLSVVLVLLLPLLLSVDLGTGKTTKLAGKLFVLHAAGTVAAECLLLQHVHERIGGATHGGAHGHGGSLHGGVLASTLHVIATSTCGIVLAWCLSSSSSSSRASTWFRALPTQDAWMAACIYASKTASLLPQREQSSSSDIGAALGTFCILATLTAPFAWYDPPRYDTSGAVVIEEEDEEEEENNRRVKWKEDRELDVVLGSSGGCSFGRSGGSSAAAGLRRRRVRLSTTLAAVHILVAMVGVKVYRKIVVLDLYPVVDVLSGGILSRMLSSMGSSANQEGRVKWLSTSAALGFQLVVLSCWVLCVVTVHFPKTKSLKRGSLLMMTFGILLSLVNPSLEMSSLWYSLLLDSGLLQKIQQYTNPQTGHAFFADKIGVSKSNGSNREWRSWALFLMILIVLNKMSEWMEILLRSQQKKRQDGGGISMRRRFSSTLSTMSPSRAVLNIRTVAINTLLGMLAACWSAFTPDATMHAVASTSHLSTSDLSTSTTTTSSSSTLQHSSLSDFATTVVVITLFFTIFERLLILPSSLLVKSRTLPAYAFLLAMLMFQIVLAEVSALLDPGLSVRRNVHPLSTTLSRIASGIGSASKWPSRTKTRRGGATSGLEEGAHEIDHLMTIHGVFHLLLAIVVRMKLSSPSFTQGSTIGNRSEVVGSTTSDNSRRHHRRRRSSGVQSVAERMRSAGADVGNISSAGAAGQRGRTSSRQHIQFMSAQEGQRVLRVIGTTSTVVCTLAVAIVCLTRSVGRYEAIFYSSFVLVLLPWRTVSGGGRYVKMLAGLFAYVICALDVEALSFDVIGEVVRRVFSTSGTSADVAGWWWWESCCTALTLIGTIPLQRTVGIFLWSGGVGGRAGLAGLILPMPLGFLCALLSSSKSVRLIFAISSIVWGRLVWIRWK